MVNLTLLQGVSPSFLLLLNSPHFLIFTIWERGVFPASSTCTVCYFSSALHALSLPATEFPNVVGVAIIVNPRPEKPFSLLSFSYEPSSRHLSFLWGLRI